MANLKKKQDDKNLKLLRELASMPCNKQCFDCYQKGPTYVNMTTGSFVCTSCSGLLRGLNPPHRVKSISMATFTQEEIEFVKARGNEYCRSVWMGRYDKGRGLDEASFKDETQMKDYLNLKYEKKRWYISPAEVTKTVNHSVGNATNTTTTKFGINETAAAPAASLATQVRSRPLNSRQAEDVQKAKETLFTLDTDPFNPSSTSGGTKLAKSIGSEGFADFANFSPQQPAASLLLDNQSSLFPMATVAGGDSLFQNVSALAANEQNLDKYSALAELDELFRHDSAKSSIPSASMTQPTSDNFVFNSFTTSSGGPFASPANSSVFGSRTAANQASSFGSTSTNPFFSTTKPQDQSNLFASLNPFGEQGVSHGIFNGTSKASSSANSTGNSAGQDMQSNWNPFL